MLKNKKTDGWLVFNTADRVQGTVDECYMLTTTTDAPGPVKRSVFQIVRAEKMDMFGSDGALAGAKDVSYFDKPDDESFAMAKENAGKFANQAKGL